MSGRASPVCSDKYRRAEPRAIDTNQGNPALRPDESNAVAIRELGREVGLAPSRVHDEVRRLEEGGLVVSERVGNLRLVRPNDRSPFYPELRGLLLKAFGPVSLLAPLLAPIAGIEDAFIYGS